MSDKKEINALDFFKFEEGTDSDIGTRITSTDGNDIPFIEDLEDKEEGSEIQDEFIDDDEDSSEEELENTDEDDNYNEDSEDSEEVGIYSTMANFLIDEGALSPIEDKDYDESEEGFSELIKDTIEIGRQEIKDEYGDIELKEGVTLRDLVEFKEAGGDIVEFLQRTVEQVDYRRVDVSTDDDDLEKSIETQKLVIRDKLTLDDLSEDEIEDTIADLEKSDTLEKQAKLALKTLIKRQDEDYTSMLKTQEQEKINRLEEIKRQEKELKDTVYSLNEVSGFKLTDIEKDKYYKYLTTPVKKDNQGNLLTQYQVDSMDVNKRLELAYLQFKGGIGSIEAKVERKKNLKLQEKLSRFAEESKNNRRSTDSFDDSTNNSTSNKGSKLKINFPNWM